MKVLATQTGWEMFRDFRKAVSAWFSAVSLAVARAPTRRLHRRAALCHVILSVTYS